MDYCGLTEDEANRALLEWVSRTDLKLGIGEYTVGGFTSSLDAVREIEMRLGAKQRRVYVARIVLMWSQEVYCNEWLIMLDAPTRVKALIYVLGLGQAETTVTPPEPLPDPADLCRVRGWHSVTPDAEGLRCFVCGKAVTGMLDGLGHE